MPKIKTARKDQSPIERVLLTIDETATSLGVGRLNG